MRRIIVLTYVLYIHTIIVIKRWFSHCKLWQSVYWQHYMKSLNPTFRSVVIEREIDDKTLNDLKMRLRKPERNIMPCTAGIWRGMGPNSPKLLNDAKQLLLIDMLFKFLFNVYCIKNTLLCKFQTICFLRW